MLQLAAIEAIATPGKTSDISYTITYMYGFKLIYWHIR